MKIAGIQKLSLLDYPDKVSCIIYTYGCNFKCSFCHNSTLLDGDLEQTKEEDIIEYLQKRKKILEGVVISGGEPTIQKDLKKFIKKIKSMGFFVKLDTNGYNPKVLKDLIDEGLIDYVAMDIKSPLDKYSTVCGVRNLKIDNIKESINILLNSKIDYEFRTTIMKEYHDIDSIKEILKMIGKKPKYYLQNFRLSENVPDKNLHGFGIEELMKMEKELNVLYKNVKIRDLYE